MTNRVTSVQAVQLRKLGYRGTGWTGEKTIVGKNARGKYISIIVPTVDEAIDWIRIKYDVVIYNNFEPYVDPIKITEKKKSQIMYGFKIKYCDTSNGWNFRQAIGKTAVTPNIYSAKRQAVNIALKYIIRNKLKKR